MNLIELTTYIINLDHVVAIKKGAGLSDTTKSVTVMLSSGQSIPISDADFKEVMSQLTDQYSIRVIEDKF